MANIPHKSKDATEEALTAIEEALKGSDLDRRPPQGAGADSGFGGPSAPPQPEEDLFDEGLPQRPAWAPDEPPRAANDDRAAIGQILQTLRRRPSRTPTLIAGLAALGWIGGAAAIAYLYGSELTGLLATPGTGLAVMVAGAAGVVVPVIFFFVLAHMVRRAQDLRLVAESMAEVAMRLAQPEAAGREAVVTVGQAVRREVAAMGDGVERALARAAELEALVHNEVSALERAYNDNEVRIRDLLSELSNQRETLVAQAEHVRNAISSVHLDLSHDITAVGDLVADKVNEVAQRVTRSLTEKGEHITLALGHAGDSMIDALSDRGSTLLERLETTSDRTTTAIGSASERLTDSLNFKTEHIHDEFAELAARLQQMMSTRLDQVAQGFAQQAAQTIDTMASRSQQFTDTLNDTGARITDNIGTRGEEVTANLRAAGESLVLDLGQRGSEVVSSMEQTGARINDTLVNRSNSVADSFRETSEALVHAIGARGDSVRDMLNVRLQAFEDMFQHGGTELTEKISRDATTLGSLITRHIAEFDQTVKLYGGELVDRLGQRTSEVSEAMRAYVDTFDQRVGDRTSELSAALDKRIGEVTGTITERGTAVADAIATKAGELDQTLGTRALEVANNLDSRIDRFEDLLVNRAEAVTTQIETRTRAAADVLNARMEQLSDTIRANSADAEQSLGRLASSASEAIRLSASEAERTLLGVSDEVARNFVGKAEEISETVSRRASEISTILSDNSGSVLAALAEKGEQFAGEITGATDQAIRSIEEKGLMFSRTLLENGSEISRMISSAGEDASSTVNRTINALHETTQLAIERSKETATSTVREMMETHDMLRADTTTLFERLREANIMLQEVLSGAHENMSSLENTLMLRVSEFVTAMNEVTASTGEVTGRVENNISDFREVTSRVINDLGQLAGQFDAHGRDLGQAIELIDTSNRRTEQSLGQRQTQLETLVSNLDNRSDDIDQRLTRFSGLLDETLEAASTRAREIARLVSESSADGARAISEQFERVRENAEDERRRTTDAMHAIYQQAAGDTHALFSDATERFAEVMQGLKQMASEMQRELDSTRVELRRGIFELPQETSENAAQMRRVIVDQIEALAELNRIVARHGRSLDAVEPMRRSREEPALAVVGGRGDAGSRSSEFPPRMSPLRGETGSSFTPPPRRPEAPPPGPAVPSGGRGWLSDLLTRASREDDEGPRDYPREVPSPEPTRGAEERTPRHSIESLDSLSVDIARMIDHEAAVDLWDRYKRGERNVFTRRLYTLQGQKAFDEIRRKYRGDREFKLTVDRYIGEFERLLDEVSRDDRGQLVARTYLTSETGKVYTMLAHAAGRFD